MTDNTYDFSNTYEGYWTSLTPDESSQSNVFFHLYDNSNGDFQGTVRADLLEQLIRTKAQFPQCQLRLPCHDLSPAGENEKPLEATPNKIGEWHKVEVQPATDLAQKYEKLKSAWDKCNDNLKKCNDTITNNPKLALLTSKILISSTLQHLHEVRLHYKQQRTDDPTLATCLAAFYKHTTAGIQTLLNGLDLSQFPQLEQVKSCMDSITPHQQTTDGEIWFNRDQIHKLISACKLILIPPTTIDGLTAGFELFSSLYATEGSEQLSAIFKKHAQTCFRELSKHFIAAAKEGDKSSLDQEKTRKILTCLTKANLCAQEIIKDDGNDLISLNQYSENVIKPWRALRYKCELPVEESVVKVLTQVDGFNQIDFGVLRQAYSFIPWDKIITKKNTAFMAYCHFTTMENMTTDLNLLAEYLSCSKESVKDAAKRQQKNKLPRSAQGLPDDIPKPSEQHPILKDTDSTSMTPRERFKVINDNLNSIIDKLEFIYSVWSERLTFYDQHRKIVLDLEKAHQGFFSALQSLQKSAAAKPGPLGFRLRGICQSLGSLKASPQPTIDSENNAAIEEMSAGPKAPTSDKKKGKKKQRISLSNVKKNSAQEQNVNQSDPSSAIDSTQAQLEKQWHKVNSELLLKRGDVLRNANSVLVFSNGKKASEQLQELLVNFEEKLCSCVKVLAQFDDNSRTELGIMSPEEFKRAHLGEIKEHLQIKQMSLKTKLIAREVERTRCDLERVSRVIDDELLTEIVTKAVNETKELAECVPCFPAICKRIAYQLHKQISQEVSNDYRDLIKQNIQQSSGKNSWEKQQSGFSFQTFNRVSQQINSLLKELGTGS